MTDDNQTAECRRPGRHTGDIALACASPGDGAADEAAFAHFNQQLIATAQALTIAGLNLSQAEGPGGVILHEARFLSYRMAAADARFCCAAKRPPNQATVLELFAGTAPGGQLPPPVVRNAPMLRFLRLQWKPGPNGPIWLYHCANIHTDRMRFPPDQSTHTIELTSEQLAAKCLNMLVMSPMFPPDARISGRVLSE